MSTAAKTIVKQASTFEELFTSTLHPKRFDGVTRPYKPTDVSRLRGSHHVEHTIANRTSRQLWSDLHAKDFVPALGCLTGQQAVQCVRAGLQAIYLSGWQVAADANSTGDMYPDQSLYACNSGPDLARRINKSLLRSDVIESIEKEGVRHNWLVPIVADCEAGFGGALNCFELTRAYIEAGVAGVHFEDQLGAEKKCGHMGGKVLIPTAQHVKHLCAARLAADVCGVPTVLIARTDAESARLMTSDVDERDHEFIDRSQSRTTEGFYQLKDDGLNCSIKRAIAFAPYCDLIWMETATPDLNMARQFAEAVKRAYPNKMLAYNCSPSFNWAAKLPQNQLATFQRELGAMGYKFQFVTLAGFHANNFGMFELAHSYKRHGMAAYSELQQREFKAESLGYTAVKHQREVGTGFFDDVATVVAGGRVSTRALVGSTEEAQFNTNATTSDLANKIPVTTTAPLTQQPRFQNARAFATQGGPAHTAEVSQPTDNVDCFVHKLL